MDYPEINDDLDRIRIAVRKASNEWESRFVIEESPDSSNADEEYVEYLVRIAYLSLLAFLDKYKMKEVSKYLVNLWTIKHSDNLLEGHFSNFADEPLLTATGTLWEVISGIENVVHKTKEEEPLKHEVRIKTLLERIPEAAFRLGINFEQESDLDKIAEALLIPIFPDINSNPSLTISESFRSPDSAIPSISTLLEYKFIKSKTAVCKIVDEMQADIRNYAQEPWKNLLFVVGQDAPYANEERIRAVLLKEPSTFLEIDVIVITHKFRKTV